MVRRHLHTYEAALPVPPTRTTERPAEFPARDLHPALPLLLAVCGASFLFGLGESRGKSVHPRGLVRGAWRPGRGDARPGPSPEVPSAEAPCPGWRPVLRAAPARGLALALPPRSQLVLRRPARPRHSAPLPGSVSARMCFTAKRWPGPAVWTVVSSRATSWRPCQGRAAQRCGRSGRPGTECTQTLPAEGESARQGPGCGPQTSSAVLVQEGDFWKGVGGSQNHPGARGSDLEKRTGRGGREPQPWPGRDVGRLSRAQCQSQVRPVSQGHVPAPPDHAGVGGGSRPLQLPDQVAMWPSAAGPMCDDKPLPKNEKRKLLSFGVRVQGRGPVQVTPAMFPRDGPFQLRLQRASGSPASWRCPQCILKAWPEGSRRGR